MAEVKMSLDEYQRLQSERDNALAENRQLKDKIATEQLSDPEGRITDLVKALKASLPIVNFATGNLDPRTVRGWPYEELATYAKVLDALPGADTSMQEAALEFRNFISEGRYVESERYSKDAAQFEGNATLTLVFQNEDARDAFMDTNKIEMRDELDETRRRHFVTRHTVAKPHEVH